jgi:hypothetical protein
MSRIRDNGDRFRRTAFFTAVDSKRQREGVSWRDVARETGVSPSTLSRIAEQFEKERDLESGANAPASVHTSRIYVHGPPSRPVAFSGGTVSSCVR